MSDKLSAELARVTVEAFSMLGFMFPLDEAPSDGQSAIGSDALVVQVSFCWPVEGVVRLRAEPQLVQMLAANMTGTDDPPPPEQQLDALKEMLNVICGNMLPSIDGQSVFDVHAPQPGQWIDGSAERADGSAHASIALDAGQVEVVMQMS